MRPITRTLAALALSLVSATVLADGPPMEEIIALHWLPETKAQARSYSVMAASSLATSTEALALSSWDGFPTETASMPVVASHLSDGYFGFWASMTDSSDGTDLKRFSWQDVPADPGHQWPLWQAVVARDVPSIWADVDASIQAELFGPLIEQLNAAQPSEQAHARAQARRVMRMNGARAEVTRQTIEGSLLLAEAKFEWEQGHSLASAWLALEGLMWMVQDQNMANARFYSGWLGEIPQASIRALRTIDINLPVIMGLLIDSANHLAQTPPQTVPALEKLGFAYHYLAFFIPDGASYLDQPIRDQMENLGMRCGPASFDELSRNDDALIVACVEDITTTMVEGLDSEELLGATGPLSVEFLSRELGLVSWQRARYLNSYVNAMLGGSCRLAEGFNVLEWNLGAQWLQSLHDGAAGELGEAFEASANGLSDRYDQWAEQASVWLDCLSSVEDGREDPIVRLLKKQLERLQRLDQLIREAHLTFYQSVTEPNADIDLNAPLPASSGYRPSNLKVSPCDAARVCGATVELPVSQAMLSLVPEGYWLADQLKVGQVQFCYDDVKWVDRQMQLVRENDAGVANFSGRLSFSVQASFKKPDQTHELVFKRRLVTDPRQDYFFGRAVQENLAIDCAHGLDGRPIQSELSQAAPGLVPKRLTYFTSIPTSVSSHLLNHWSQGQNWQAQLMSDGQVEVLVASDDEGIRSVAEAQRLALIDRRERSMATRLTRFDDASADDLLAQTMLEIDTLSRLIRRIMELHYGPILRLDDDMRAMLAGDQGLLTREDIRSARDRSVLMTEVAGIGIERVNFALDAWSKWPQSIRQTGLVPPELQTARAMISAWQNLPSDGLSTSQTTQQNIP